MIEFNIYELNKQLLDILNSLMGGGGGAENPLGVRGHYHPNTISSDFHINNLLRS